MNSQYILSHYIKNINNIDNVNKHLYTKFNIMNKSYPDFDMTIYYNKFLNKHKSLIEMASRSVVISSTNSVICYTCATPIYNMEATQYMWRNKDKKRETYVCYEGSLMSIFNYKDVWYIASRKNIYSPVDYNESKQSGHLQMFIDTLANDGYETVDKFTQMLNKELSYHFVLIHHLNENIVNYSQQFGANYMKLCFIFARNITTQEEIKSEDVVCTFVSDNIFLPKIINESDTETFLSNLSEIKQPENEGLIIKMNGQILKLQSSAYMFYRAIGTEKNMFRGFISLYQNNSLKSYLVNDKNDKFRKIVNPLNTTESFDIVGMIDALFKIVTSELYNLFYVLWNDEGTHLNNDLYKMLPREYKDMLFHIRGLYFTNKKNVSNTPVLRMKDVYNYIKSIDVSIFEKFIRCRKLMLNWTRLETHKNIPIFNQSLYKCEKVYYKLAAIYTTKLFPEIMPDDVPVFGQDTLNTP